MTIWGYNLAALVGSGQTPTYTWVGNPFQTHDCTISRPPPFKKFLEKINFIYSKNVERCWNSMKSRSPAKYQTTALSFSRWVRFCSVTRLLTTKGPRWRILKIGVFLVWSPTGPTTFSNSINSRYVLSYKFSPLKSAGFQ